MSNYEPNDRETDATVAVLMLLGMILFFCFLYWAWTTPT